MTLVAVLAACAAPAPTARPSLSGPIVGSTLGGCTVQLSPDGLSGSWSCPEQTPTPPPPATETATETPTATETASSTPTATGTPTATPSATATPSSTPTATSVPAGVPFGPLHLPDANFSDGAFSGALAAFGNGRRVLTDTLTAAQANHVHLWINLTGARVQTADGAFDLAQWERNLDVYRGFDLSPYLSDGTVLALIVADEPQDPTNWNGLPVPYADLEAACVYARSIWPALHCGAYSEATWLAQYAGWQAFDVSISQYTAKKGVIETFIANNVAAAASDGLTLYFAINALGGGPGGAKVTGAELADWGGLMLAEPSACGLAFYRYDTTYLALPDVLAANQALADLAAARSACP